jgi:hypothetical protein
VHFLFGVFVERLSFQELKHEKNMKRDTRPLQILGTLVLGPIIFLNTGNWHHSGLIKVDAQETPQINSPAKLRTIEGYPPKRIEALQEEEKRLEILLQQGDGSRLRSFIDKRKTWRPGTPITVAFNGGTPELYRQITDGVRPWADAANIVFDFGYVPETGQYRVWTTGDKKYSADIRIAFYSDSTNGGYWSALGRDSIRKNCSPGNTSSCYFSNEASMNLQGFADELPSDWQAVLLHEFGHALGFNHEHQSSSSTCEQEYRWDDDNGYAPITDGWGQFIPNGEKKPGVYRVLGGPLNNWTRAQIDFNLRKLPNLVGLKASPFDKDSIMKYHFDAWMYVNPDLSTQSGCFGPAATTLSTMDQAAALEMYPRNEAEVKAVIEERIDTSKNLLKTKNIPEDFKSLIKSDIKFLKKDR